MRTIDPGFSDVKMEWESNLVMVSLEETPTTCSVKCQAVQEATQVPPFASP